MSVDTPTGRTTAPDASRSSDPDAGHGEVTPRPDEVTLTIDGQQVGVPKGTLLIRAAERLGIAIPRFCDHPLLDPVGACRQCLVEIPDMGNGRGMPKPQASCTVEVAQGMVVNTQLTSAKAHKAQEGILELLLINHPLDCPICDKGGECPLQNQALANGRAESRYGGVKRTYPKPVHVSAQILLDRERCVLCARCTRFSEQISGDPFIALTERGALQQVGFYEDAPYDSYFSGNVVQICPVGALTSADYRFQARPFDLVSTATSCEQCASGCSLRTDHRHFQVKRRLAGIDPEVNDEWNCDRGRFGFRSGRLDDRLTMPLVRHDGVLEPASWAEAIDVAATGLMAAGSRVGVLTGGRLLQESAHAFSKFARTVLGTNNIDCRARSLSAEETWFLTGEVAGRRVEDSVTYADLSSARTVLLVDLEPEDESPMVFLRLRRAMRKQGTRVVTVAPLVSSASRRLDATWVPCAPGDESRVLAGLDADLLEAPAIVLVGERAAATPGTLTAVRQLARRTGARLAWVPRRAGEVGAIDAGCLPTLLPGGRPVIDPGARVDAASVWGAASLPSSVGLDTNAMLEALSFGALRAVVLAGVQLDDLDDPAGARAALDRAGFVVSFEQRLSEAAHHADVVFPVPLVEQQNGTFVDWEHRPRPVRLVDRHASAPMTETRTLAALADAMGHDLGMRGNAASGAELAEFGRWEPTGAEPEPGTVSLDTAGGLRLATWRELIDDAAALDGSGALLRTARRPVARMSAATALAHGLQHGADVQVCVEDAGRPAQRVVLPVEVVDRMCDDVVWLPARPREVGLVLPAAAAGRARVTLAPVPRTPSASGATAAPAGSPLAGGEA